MSRARGIVFALCAFAVGIGLGRWDRDASKPSEVSETAPEQTRQVLYWYDPMKPDHHFSQPGKSPFMDMELQPKYADEVTSASVRVDSALAQNLGVRLTRVVTAPLPALTPVPGVVQWNGRGVAVVQTRAAGFVTRVFDRAPGDLLAQGAPLAELQIPAWVGLQAEYLALRASGDAALAAAARRRLLVLGVPAEIVAAVERSGQAVTTIRIGTPIAGVLTELDVRKGMRLEEGATLAVVNDVAEVWVEAAWPVARSAEATIGSSVEVTLDAAPGDRVAGRIDSVLPDADPESRTVRVRIVLPNPGGRLRPGMLVTVEPAADAARPVLQVPDSAIVRGAQGSFVFLAEGAGRFLPMRVVPGVTAGGRTEIRAGLEDGQRIVESGQFLLDSEANLSGVLAQFETAPALSDEHTHEGHAHEGHAHEGHAHEEHGHEGPTHATERHGGD